MTGILQIINQSEERFRMNGTVAVDSVCLSESVYSYCDGYGFMHCSLIPIERMVTEMFIVYHIWYTDGTEQILIEDY